MLSAGTIRPAAGAGAYMLRNKPPRTDDILALTSSAAPRPEVRNTDSAPSDRAAGFTARKRCLRKVVGPGETVHEQAGLQIA